MKTLFSVLMLSLLAGCHPEGGSKANTDQKLSLFPPPAAAKRDANPEPSLLVHLSVYRILVPAKSISHNEEFWKHVSEDEALDVGAHDLLFANGFRAGLAPRADWDYFKQIIESNNIVSQMTAASGVTTSSFEIPVKSKILKQFITFFHPINGLVGQMYDRCENSIAVRFEPVPRKPGEVRVTVTPLLRAERTELLYTNRNEVWEYNFVHPEYLFDLKLSVDVPIDQFLIVAPSPDADVSTSLGRKFLYQDGEGQEFEQMLLISPQPFRLEKKATTVPSSPP